MIYYPVPDSFFIILQDRNGCYFGHTFCVATAISFVKELRTTQCPYRNRSMKPQITVDIQHLIQILSPRQQEPVCILQAGFFISAQ